MKTALAALVCVFLAACAGDPDPTDFEGTWRLVYSGQPCFSDNRIEAVVVGAEAPGVGYLISAWNGEPPMSSRTANTLDGYAIDLVSADGEMLSINLALIDPPAASVEWTGLNYEEQPCGIERLAASVTKTSD